MNLRLNDDSISKREIDNNGFLTIRDNPIAKAGVFDYLESELKEGGADKIVRVCRTFDDLRVNKALFAGKPIKYKHFWVGDAGEVQHVEGAIMGEIKEADPYLKADIVIYDKELIDKIISGEARELSPAYELADLVEGGGTYNGQSYTYEQKLKSVNHVAVVERGRSGSDLRVLDENKIQQEASMTFKDALKIVLNKIKDEGPEAKEASAIDAAKKELIDLALKDVADFEGGVDEKALQIQAAVQKLVDAYLESTKSDDDVKEVADDVVEASSDDDKVLNITPDELVEIIEKVVDAKILKQADAANAEQQKVLDAYKEVSGVLKNSFDYKGKSASEIYAFGVNCLGGRMLDGMDALTAFRVLAASVDNQVKVTDGKTDSKISQLLAKIN